MQQFEQVPSSGKEQPNIADEFRSLGADKYGLEFLQKNMQSIDTTQARSLIDQLRRVQPVNEETRELLGKVMNALQEKTRPRETAPIVSAEVQAARHQENAQAVAAMREQIDELMPVSGGDDWIETAKGGVTSVSPTPVPPKKPGFFKRLFGR